MIATLSIAGGYALLIWQFGWAGAIVAAAGTAIMLAALPRR